MRITPFRVLEEHARQEYRKRFANAPEPRVINARPLATLDAPRSFVWGGIGYWCPPLSYEGGSRLLIAANALRDLRKSGNAVRTDAARITAARIVRQHVRSRRPLWRLTRAFYVNTAEELEGLCRWLIKVEDEATIVPSDKPITVDLVDNLATFAREIPAWTHTPMTAFFASVTTRQRHRAGDPYSWARYVFGIRHIGRAANREDLRGATAARQGVNASEKQWREFERDMKPMCGWVN